MSVDNATGTAAFRSDATRHSWRVLGGRDVGEVLIAALGDEVGLRDHGEAQVGQVFQIVVGHQCGVLDAIQRMAAGGAQGRDGHDELGRGHAVHRHRPTGAVLLGDPADQRVQVETVVVQDLLARRQEVQPRPELTATVRHHERDHVVGVEVGGRVGDAGDAGRGDAAAEFGQVGFAPRQRLRPAAVGAAQAPVGVFGQADPAQRGGVEDPQRAAAVLDAHRNVGHDGVERGPVQVAGHRLVIADGANPPVGARAWRSRVFVPVGLWY